MRRDTDLLLLYVDTDLASQPIVYYYGQLFPRLRRGSFAAPTLPEPCAKLTEMERKTPETASSFVRVHH